MPVVVVAMLTRRRVCRGVRGPPVLVGVMGSVLLACYLLFFPFPLLAFGTFS